MVPIKATPADGYRLFMQGMEALSKVENNGIRIDTDYLSNIQKTITEEVRKEIEFLKADAVFKLWRRRFGEKTKITSPDQLAWLVYGELGYTPVGYTATGKPKMDEEALERIDHPWVKRLTEILKLKSLQTDFLNGVERETCDGFLHPIFNLNLVETYRSSSDSPNFQNFPNRNKKQKRLVRKCFLPRRKRYWVSFDYSGIEVRIAYCYHKDPAMYRYLTEKGTDMHRDAAAQIYKCHQSLVSDQMRHTGKNMFVFPQFYGSFYVDCAKSMWNECQVQKIRLKARPDEEDGSPTGPLVVDYLRKKGITELGACDEEQKPHPGTFEYQVKTVEEDFWNNRFKVYTQWKKEWYRRYLETGEFGMFTGFKVRGSYRRNQVINYPVQGPAFHCLLLSLILVQKEIERRRMKSLIIGQIHDSMECDVCEDELQDFIPMVQEIMTKQVPKMWDWISVPLTIGVEIARPGETWADKAKWAPNEKGIWQLKV